MRQQTFAGENVARLGKKTRPEQCLDAMERIIPRQALPAAIEPFCPNPRGAGRPVGGNRAGFDADR